jgi:tetratricopeptide (TPR) repeat protein
VTGELFLSRFTPSMMSADVLEKVFVQRGDLADRLVNIVRESVLTPSKHHTLVIGSRGIGKTHLLSLVQNRVAGQEDLTERVRIAWLREEEWGVASFLDFLYRILRALAVQYTDEELRAETENLFSLSLKTAERRAGDLLRSFLGDKTLLLIAENLDGVFEGLKKKGQQRLRAYLQEESSWTILGSSQALFGGITLFESPFFGFFDIHHLQELTVDDAARLVRNIAELANDTGLAEYVLSEAGRARIRAVHHLAGGNHRVYIILSEFLTRDSLDQLVEPFLRMMDDLTPYYQARMEQLSPQQRKIIDLLCNLRGAVPVKEIAKRCFISSQTASGQLRDLRERGYVESTPVGRDAYYELAEPLMRLALEVKSQRSGHIRLFVDFLRHWYARTELVDLLAHAPAESVLEREYLHQVLSEENADAATPHVQKLLGEINEPVSLGDWKQVFPIAEQLVQARGSVVDWSLLSQCLTGLGRHQEALAVSEKALNVDDSFSSAWIARAIAMSGLNRNAEALDAMSRAFACQQMGDAYMYGLHAVLLRGTGRLEEALQASNRALELSPDLVLALLQKSELLIQLNRHEDALDVLSRAVALEPNSSEIRAKYGLLLIGCGRFPEALHELEAALQSDSHQLQVQQGRALALSAAGQEEEALEAAKLSYAIAPDDPYSSWILAWQLMNMGQFASVLPLLEVAGTGNVAKVAKGSMRNARIRAYLGLNRLEDAREHLRDALASGENTGEMVPFTEVLLVDIFVKDRHDVSRRDKARLLYAAYLEHSATEALAVGLVTTAKTFLDQNTPESAARAWIGLWRELDIEQEEFDIALRLMDVTLDYRVTPDPRILLRLASEERRVVEQVIASAGYGVEKMVHGPEAKTSTSASKS